MVSKGGLKSRISAEVHGGDLPVDLWFSVPNEFADGLAVEQPNWIATSLLVPAMLRGMDIEIDAGISPKLLFAINGDLQYILRKQNDRLKKITVRARRRSKAPVSLGYVGTGFSAGVDTLCTIADYASEETPEEFRINTLVNNNVGALGDNKDAEAVFERQFLRTQGYAASKGSRAISINSNLASFFTKDFLFQNHHTIKNISAILAVQGLFNRYYYSAGHRYDEMFVGQTSDMAFADPLILSLLGTDNMEFVSSGAQYTRWEKAARVSAMPDAYGLLDVCATDATVKRETKFVNCGTCFKCARQLFTLEFLGRLNEFEGQFDIAAYEAKRDDLLIDILNASRYNKPDAEIVRAAEAAGLITKQMKAKAFARRLPNGIKWRINRLKQRFA